MASLIFETVNGRCCISSSFLFINPEGSPSDAGAVLERVNRGDLFSLDDPARAAVGEQHERKEIGQFEVPVAIGAVFNDKLYFTLKALIPVLENEEKPIG